MSIPTTPATTPHVGLDTLPNELLLALLTYLPTSLLAQLRSLSRLFREVCSDVIRANLLQLRDGLKNAKDIILLADSAYSLGENRGPVAGFKLTCAKVDVDRVGLVFLVASEPTSGLYVPLVGYLPLLPSRTPYGISDAFSPEKPPRLRLWSESSSFLYDGLHSLPSSKSPIEAKIGSWGVELETTVGSGKAKVGWVEYEVVNCMCQADQPSVAATDGEPESMLEGRQCAHRSVDISKVFLPSSFLLPM
ncbi:uncharacterized protein EV422DRAFT_513807 [Fimicolochytrium jonesii]|uniref:uncharacterized protein n=1 Tax=Fimicolochytrium jonesii TaxID=1396493 RepID=UPI0022FDD429|nr:uncharacterized protein EV422DRAFT_513807 [Fimicolochytrium jonesii]KAI8825674.1 hypothetical protein EV422DRAFT_513807 [Fimicolochytrium jonesii]